MIRPHFDLTTRNLLKAEFTKLRGGDDAGHFVYMLEALVLEVKQRPRDANASAEHLERAAGAFAKAADALYSTTGTELAALLTAARQQLAQDERRRLRALGPTSSWDLPASKSVANSRMEDLGLNGLSDAADTLRRTAESLALIGRAAASAGRPTRQHRSTRQMLALGVLGVFEVFDLPPGGRKGFAADALAEVLALAGLDGNAGPLIERAKADRKGAEKSPI